MKSRNNKASRGFAKSSACQKMCDLQSRLSVQNDVFSNLQVVAGAAWAVYRLMQDTPVRNNFYVTQLLSYLGTLGE